MPRPFASAVLMAFAFALALALADAAAAATAPAGVAPADLQVFEAALLARLHLRAADLAAADLGIACDAAPPAMNVVSVPLGALGSLSTTCTPAGWSQGVLSLADGTDDIAHCKGPGDGPRFAASLRLGDHEMKAATRDHNDTAAPTHACSGWLKLPGAK